MSLTQSQFQSNCGEFLGHTISTHGIAPMRTFIVTFHYVNGYSCYDGKNWIYHASIKGMQ